MLVCTLVLAIVAAYIYLRVATRYFVSTAKMQVKQESRVVLNSSSGDGQLDASTFAAGQAELLKSEAVLLIAADRISQDPDATRFARPTLESLKQRVSTEVDRGSMTITLSAKATDAGEARLIANAVLAAYTQYVLNPNRDPELQQRYATALAEAEAQLQAKEQELAQVTKEYGGIPAMGDRSTSLKHTRLAELVRQHDQKKQELVIAEDYAQRGRRMLSNMNGSTAPSSGPAQSADDPLDIDAELGGATPQALEALQQAIVNVQGQLEVLTSQGVMVNNPRVEPLQRSLHRLRRSYALKTQQYESLVARQHEALTALVAQAQADVDRSETAAERRARLSLEIAERQKVRDTWKSKMVEASSPGLTVTMEAWPGMPRTATLPEPAKVYVVAVALGVVLGMVLAAGREWLDDRMRSAGEIKSSLGMPLLAVIPQSATKRSFSVGGQRVLLDPGSDAAEAYRSLRTAIQFAAPEGLRTLMVASPNSGDGKTTLVSNLGIAMAQSGKRVCIIDADLRKPSIHDIFSLKTTLGLCTLLAGRSTLDGSVQHTNVNGLDVLPCGPAPANPTEVLNSQEFGNAIDELADRYDIVLIDSPPVSAADDARVIAASCDASLLVLTAKRANRRVTEQARDALQGVGARIIGLVVNDVPGREGNNYGTTNRAMKHVVPGLTSQEYDILQARAK